jgi:hypothetical protein
MFCFRSYFSVTVSVVHLISFKSDKDGSIMSEEMVSFLLNDNRTVSMGISEDMIRGCIDTAKVKGQGKRTWNRDRGQV